MTSSKITDQEVDRLLREAEALTKAIELDAASSSNDDEVPALESADDSRADPDPSDQAVLSEPAGETEESSAEQIEPEGLKDLLHDPDAELCPPHADEPMAVVEDLSEEMTAAVGASDSESKIDHQVATGDDSATDAISNAAEPDPDDAVTQTEDHHDKTQDSADRAENEPSNTIDEPHSEHGAVASHETSPSASNVDDGETLEGESQKPSEDGGVVERAARPPLMQKMKQAMGTVVRVSISLPIAVINTLPKFLIVLDRPFANISLGVKQKLGYVALATLLAGIAARFLPDLFNHNPFAEMGTGTRIGP